MDEEWRQDLLEKMGDKLDIVRRCLPGMPSREAVVVKLMRSTTKQKVDSPEDTNLYKICTYLDGLRVHQGAESIKSTVITPCVKYKEFCQRIADKLSMEKAQDVANNISNNKILLPMGVVRRGYKKRVEELPYILEPKVGVKDTGLEGSQRVKKSDSVNSIVIEASGVVITINIEAKE